VIGNDREADYTSPSCMVSTEEMSKGSCRQTLTGPKALGLPVTEDLGSDRERSRITGEKLEIAPPTNLLLPASCCYPRPGFPVHYQDKEDGRLLTRYLII
jgi:hypothetical protein